MFEIEYSEFRELKNILNQEKKDNQFSQAHPQLNEQEQIDLMTALVEDKNMKMIFLSQK